MVIRGEGKRHYRSSRLNRVDKYLSRAFENLPRFQNTRLGGANSHDPRKSSLFDTHLETHESWRNLEVNGFKKQSFAREPLLERSPFIKEGGGTELSPATVQNYFLVPTRGRSTRHYAASPPTLRSFPPSSPPLYIYIYFPSLPSLFPLRPLRVPYERTGAAKHCRRSRRKQGNHLPLLIPREE